MKKFQINLHTHFISFDVVDVYLSITDDLLATALIFYEFNIPDQEKRKNSDWNFDITMGRYHNGAEACELVTTYLLSQLPATYRVPKQC